MASSRATAGARQALKLSCRSPAQGEATLDGWNFTSNFDSGNALFTSWRREPPPPPVCNEDGATEEPLEEIPSFSVEIARDCHGDPRVERPRAFWFHFGVVPPNPNFGGDIRLTVRRMIPMSDMFAAGYRPWVSTPSARHWQRVNTSEIEQSPCASHDGMFDLSWRYRFEEGSANGTTYFAFCIPYSYTSLLDWLRSLEAEFKQRQQQYPHDYARERDSDASRLPQVSSRSTESDKDTARRREMARDWPQLWHDMSHRPGSKIYFRRQLIAVSLQGRNIELLTITEAVEGAGSSSWPREELPESVAEAIHQQCVAGNVLDPAPPTPDGALRFVGRPICFISGRVHPGETPAQFAVNGFLRFILSDDPRAVCLRRRYVFKVCPMLNPDGVALGHTRLNSRGCDLNRCYRDPVPEQHEGVFAVKELLLSWATRGDLLLYVDCHAHTARRGCFLFGNLQGSSSWSSKDSLLWNLAYAHIMQLNTPHLDIDACEWSPFLDSTAVSGKTPKSGVKEDQAEEEQDVEDDGPETSRSDSGRAQIGTCCRLYHAYTLECNYHMSRTLRPVPAAPGLPKEAQHIQLPGTGSESLVAAGSGDNDGTPTRSGGREGCPRSKTKPAPYCPRAWVAVGEALAVALLDLHGLNPHSRLLVARPPKPLLPPGKGGGHGDLTDGGRGLERLFRALAKRHYAFQQLLNGSMSGRSGRERSVSTARSGADQTPKSASSFTAGAPALPALTDAVVHGDERSPRRRVFRVVHSPSVNVRDRPSRDGKQIGTKRIGDTVLVLQVRRDGWVQLDACEVAKLLQLGAGVDIKGAPFMLSPGCSSPDAFMLVRSGGGATSNELLQDTGEAVDAPPPPPLPSPRCRDGGNLSCASGRWHGQRLPAVVASVAPLIEDVENGKYPLPV